MKVRELIQELKFYNEDLDVVIFDWRKNAAYADEDGSSEGVYSPVEVSLESNEDNDDFISISFNNEDFLD